MRNSEQASEKQGLAKAARMLLALGTDNAAKVLKHLDEKTVTALAGEINRAGKLTAEELRELTAEFKSEIHNIQNTLKGGRKVALEFIEKSLGKERAQAFFDKLEDASYKERFHSLQAYPPSQSVAVLTAESAQTIALVLSQLEPSYGAAVLKELPAPKRAEVARKLGRMSKINPEALKAVLESLEKKLEANSTRQQEVKPHGEGQLTKILQFLDQKSEDQILQAIEADDTAMAERIRLELFTFDDLLNLTRNELRKLIELINDDEKLALALKGAGAELRSHILSGVTVRRASHILDTVDAMGAVRLAEVEKARREILQLSEELHRRGEIFLRKDRDEFVE